jgi:hypothetical protein
MIEYKRMICHHKKLFIKPDGLFECEECGFKFKAELMKNGVDCTDISYAFNKLSEALDFVKYRYGDSINYKMLEDIVRASISLNDIMDIVSQYVIDNLNGEFDKKEENEMKLNELCRFFVSDAEWDYEGSNYLDSLEDAVSLLWSMRETDQNYLYICLQDEDNPNMHHDEATIGRIIIDKDDNIWWFNTAPDRNTAYQIEHPEEILELLKKNEYLHDFLVF